MGQSKTWNSRAENESHSSPGHHVHQDCSIGCIFNGKAKNRVGCFTVLSALVKQLRGWRTAFRVSDAISFVLLAAQHTQPAAAAKTVPPNHKMNSNEWVHNVRACGLGGQVFLFLGQLTWKHWLSGEYRYGFPKPWQHCRHPVYS